MHPATTVHSGGACCCHAASGNAASMSRKLHQWRERGVRELEEDVERHEDARQRERQRHQRDGGIAIALASGR
jgi:hypothetical protein